MVQARMELLGSCSFVHKRENVGRDQGPGRLRAADGGELAANVTKWRNRTALPATLADLADLPGAHWAGPHRAGSEGDCRLHGAGSTLVISAPARGRSRSTGRAGTLARSTEPVDQRRAETCLGHDIVAGTTGCAQHGPALLPARRGEARRERERGGAVTGWPWPADGGMFQPAKPAGGPLGALYQPPRSTHAPKRRSPQLAGLGATATGSRAQSSREQPTCTWVALARLPLPGPSSGQRDRARRHAGTPPARLWLEHPGPVATAQPVLLAESTGWTREESP